MQFAATVVTVSTLTRRMCATPGVMEQERFFLKALETVATMRMEGDGLELRTKDGALAVGLLRSRSHNDAGGADID